MKLCSCKACAIVVDLDKIEYEDIYLTKKDKLLGKINPIILHHHDSRELFLTWICPVCKCPNEGE